MMEGVNQGLSDAVQDGKLLLALFTHGPLNGTTPTVHSDLSSVKDLTNLCVYMLVMATIIVIGRMLVLSPLATLLGFKKGTEAHTKCVMASTELVFYTWSSATAYLWYMHSGLHSWVYPSNYADMYEGTDGSGELENPGIMRLTYFIELAWYLVNVCLLLVDARRADFWPMFIHHVVTIFLVSISWCAGFARSGVVIILLHNVTDVFLNLSKILNYVKTVLDVPVFFAFALSFAYCRLYLFPQCILVQYRNVTRITATGTPVLGDFLCWAASILVVLHMYWFMLVLRMIKHFLVDPQGLREAGDIREDSDSDDTAAKDGSKAKKESKKDL